MGAWYDTLSSDFQAFVVLFGSVLFAILILSIGAGSISLLSIVSRYKKESEEHQKKALELHKKYPQMKKITRLMYCKGYLTVHEAKLLRLWAIEIEENENFARTMTNLA